MKKHFLLVAAGILSMQLSAQQDTALLDEAIITASKFEQKQSQTGKVVTVITREQLEKSGGKSITQLLNEQAGITINGAYNAPGSVQTVYTRGSASGRTLILIDGIPVSDPSMINNEFDLNLISVNDVERIEICRGAQSTLYGSDAIGGVINIITVKKDITAPLQLKLVNSIGNKNTFRNNLQLFGKMGKLTYTTRFARLRTDGFSSANDSTSINDYDKDGYDGSMVNASLRFQALPSLQLKGFIQHSRYKSGIDASIFTDEKDYEINNSYLTTGAGLVYKKDSITITANYQYGEMIRKYFNDSLYAPGFTKYETNLYGSRSQYAELFATIKPVDWLIILAGGDYRWGLMYQNYFSITSFGPYTNNVGDSSLRQTSFYVSGILSALKKKLTVEIGGRVNRHSRYGTNTTFTFNPSFAVSPAFRVFGSIASAYKAPSVYQLFDGFSGNGNLQPEKSVNYEIGFQHLHEKIKSRAVYFHRNIRDGIDYDYINFNYYNFIKQSVDGFELETVVTPVKRLNLLLNYTLITGQEVVQSRKTFVDTTYEYLLRRPKHSVNINVGYQFTKGLSVNISGKAVSNRRDVGGFMADDVLLNNYFILNAYAEYKWKSTVKIFFDMQNITSTRFYDIRGYNAIPFLITGGISVQL